MKPRLYCFGESGNAYKAALALELAGLEWEPVFVDFFNGEARSPEYLEKNPMGEVPILEVGALHLSQSGAIQDWVIEQTGKLGGKGPGERREIWRWVLWDNHKLSGQAGTTRFLMHFLPEEKRPHEVIRFFQGRLHAAFKTLENVLCDRRWLVGNEISAADISCCGYLFYPEPFGFFRAEWPNIDAWLARISEQPGWKHPYDLMPGNPSDRA